MQGHSDAKAMVGAVMEVRGSVPPGQAPAPRPYEGVFRFTAPALDSSVPRIRHAVREIIADLGVPMDDDLLYGLLLIVSELVTNAVKHAAVLSPEIPVELAVGADWIRVAVEDNHPYRPKALETDHARTGGRGLLLVKSVTDEAGGSCDTTQTPTGGKVIWAALPLRATAD
ncbi:Histidine kinase-like ATPase domain-containing protein [Streptomyces sp. DvalAA-14]|nr:Histidine kinase-like ATPase domain-containing protein [Streptomyces sp. DvalAA-14]